MSARYATPRSIRPEPMTARDFLGYGPETPDPLWPGGARIAVNFNLNVEGGAENSLANGDAGSEPMLNDIGEAARPGVRAPLVESVFEYGPRRGAWRLLELFRAAGIPISVLAVGRAAELYPDLFRRFAAEGHEIVSHHYRWIDYAHLPEAEERAHVAAAISAIAAATGRAPSGWMTGRPGQNTRRLVCEAEGLLYDRDSLADELPWWVDPGTGRPHLVIPYSFEANDNRFDANNGFATAGQYFEYHRDAFDLMREEGLAGHPKLLSIGLHDRLIGRPGRAAGLKRLIAHMASFGDVWFCTGADIHRHWAATFPPDPAA
ncbi:polysaccharide deacetylase family protein [Poseidonocella sp. HB161398]|uniref:polysaccharide deacetylase family protein n=1 Tax=Poseidonocella sp. HB161398 TaxID=2320855 RepID=UPI001F110D5A|nr:polysaccharide deacetylase family protein [Poseidonocella sp. HB161398]